MNCARSRAKARLGGASTTVRGTVRLGTALALVVGVIGAGGVPAGAAAAPVSSPLRVFVGYADGLRGSSPDFPAPWQGDPNVTFAGGSESGSFDAGAVRIDNSSTSPVSLDGLTVDVGDTSFNSESELWSELTVPAASGEESGHLIVTQTSDYNFDTSEVGPPGDCGTPNAVIPRIHVTVAGTTTDVSDGGQVLNTGGVDGANCPPGSNESHAWVGVTADVGVDLTATPNHVNTGAKAQFEAVVTNNGPDDATNTVLAEHLSAGSFAPSSVPAGCSLTDSQNMTCDLGSIGSGDSETRDVLVTAPAGDFSDTATAAADQGDFNTSNDSATANVTICVDCTGGFVTNGGTLNGPAIDRNHVKQSATLVVPTGITGGATSDNVGSDVVPDCAGFEQYGKVFLVVTPPSTPANPFTFKLTLESNNDPTLGVPIQEPVGHIKVLRDCTPEKHCVTNGDGTFSIPVAKPGKPFIHGCVFQVHRNNQSGTVIMKTLDDGAAGDPPIRGGG
jgi:uncharacterized repeat protein (TIGR01451 family)